MITSQLHTRRLNLADLPSIHSLQLSPEHQQEALDCSGCSTVTEALKICLSLSRVTWVLESDDEGIIGVFGLGSREGEVYPWYFASPVVRDRYWFTLARGSKPMVDLWKSKFPYMVNYAWAENKRDLRWLEWLGFQIVETPILINENEYLKFYMHGGSD